MSRQILKKMKKKKRMQVNAILVEDAVNEQSVVDVDLAVVVVVEIPVNSKS